MDLVMTVCDSAAAETCPVVFRDFLRTHWGLPDPAAAGGSDGDKRAAFKQAHRVIHARLLPGTSLTLSFGLRCRAPISRPQSSRAWFRQPCRKGSVRVSVVQ